MWTQRQVEEIVQALWYLPADKLLEAKNFVLSLKERYGYDQPVDCSDEWTEEDERDFARASMLSLELQDPTEAKHVAI
jgi:hypothetical protein